MISADTIRIYADHESEIRPIWEAMGEGATMREAVERWQVDRHKGRAEIYAEAKSLFGQYRALGYSKREAKRLVREDLEKRYAGDGRILAILYWILKFALLFIFIL